MSGYMKLLILNPINNKKLLLVLSYLIMIYFTRTSIKIFFALVFLLGSTDVMNILLDVAVET